MRNLGQHSYLPKPVESVLHVIPTKVWHIILLNVGHRRVNHQMLEPSPAAQADTLNSEFLGPTSMNSTLLLLNLFWTNSFGTHS